MTEETELTSEASDQNAKQHEQPQSNNDPELPAEILSIFEFLSYNKKIIFQSQQIDDPELHPKEKQKIAHELYVKNQEMFFQRFGNYLNECQLNDFERLNTVHRSQQPEIYEKMQILFLDYKQKLQTRKLCVKNRRYAAMQDLIKNSEYFSENEMLKRAPELYQELIGQYLSETEKKQRDSYDVRNTTFSGILMHSLEQKQVDELLEQASAEIDDDNETATMSIEEIVDVAEEVPANFRQQWGNFDNEQIACSTSRVEPIVPKTAVRKKMHIPNFISAGERELLRQEFIGIMHAKFLAGEDSDYDYDAVDNNVQLDDLRQLNQDKEDAYFEESDDDDAVNDVNLDAKVDELESEDELDIYMKHLNNHHSLQK